MSRLPVVIASEHKKRLDIQGLRAIAVLAVFVFHIDYTLMPGGFVGVDIFFVLSGYLIENILFVIFTDAAYDASSLFYLLS